MRISDRTWAALPSLGLGRFFQKLSNIGLPSFRGHVSLVSLEAEMTRDVTEQNKATTAEKINTESELAMDETKRAVRNAIQTMQRPRIVTARLLVLLCYLFLLTEAGAGSSTEQLRATVDKVLTIVRSSNPKSKTQIGNQRAQLIAAIYPRFDFQEMAKRSLGRHWARRSPEEQREFVGIFAALMGRAYADNIESYTGQNVVYTREKEDQNYAEVDTKLVADKGPPVTVNYKLHSVDKEWKVYDLIIEDISVVNNYRSQFDRVIARSSFADLVRTMKDKQ
jgi:phospholipid transport system substrate-binding protein